jgi:hypothetical protein
MKWRIIKITSGIIALVAFLNMIWEWMLTNHNIVGAKELKIQEWVSFFFLIIGIITYFTANEKDEFSK